MENYSLICVSLYVWGTTHNYRALTGSRCRPGEVRAESIDEKAESRETADVAAGREIDNIDRGVLLPSVDY